MESGGTHRSACGRPVAAGVAGEVGAPGWSVRALGWLSHVAVVATTVWFWATAVLLIARVIDDRVVVHGVASPASLLARYYLLLALICALFAARVGMRPDGSVAGRDLVLAGAVGPLLIALAPAALLHPGAVAWVVGPIVCARALRAVVRRVARERSGVADDGSAVATVDGKGTG